MFREDFSRITSQKFRNRDTPNVGLLATKDDTFYNLGHNIFRPFDVLPKFPFTTSETNHDY